MILGIDASNIRRGGTVTHLVELLRHVNPQEYGFKTVIVWSGRETLAAIDDRSWLIKSYQPLLDKNLIIRAYWQRFKLSKLAKKAACNLLFVPGGAYAGSFSPVVTMSQNLLPFQWEEFRRFGFSRMFIKMLILRSVQKRTLRAANGIIFLSRYAQTTIMKILKYTKGKIIVIPHGIDERFFFEPRTERPINEFSSAIPFKVIYVSTIDVYKHQDNVVDAVAKIRSKGFPISIDFIGPSYGPALKKLDIRIKQIDPSRKFIRYLGPISYDELHHQYKNANICLFASSCENMPNILLEGMAAGLPIACSDRGPMPEILGEAGVYFDPENIESIVCALQNLVDSPELRESLANKSFVVSKRYSWIKSADETFSFFSNLMDNQLQKRTVDNLIKQ